MSNHSISKINMGTFKKIVPENYFVWKYLSTTLLFPSYSLQKHHHNCVKTRNGREWRAWRIVFWKSGMWYLGPNEVYEIIHFWTAVAIGKKKPEKKKKIRASTGFEPVTCALSVCCSTNWAMKPHIGSEVNLLSSYLPWGVKWYEFEVYEIIHFWTAVVDESEE